MFRELGRQYELFIHIARRTAEDASITRCESCRAWITQGDGSCLYCGHRPSHEVLNVSPDASVSEVRRAARERLKETHPDHGGSRVEFQRILAARDRMLEP